MIGIYKITSPSGKIYIGQSTNIEKRIKGYKKLYCKNQTKLYHSFLKYGVDNHIFEVIQECTVVELNDLECFYIKLYNTFNTKNGLNLLSGGKANTTVSKETREKISIVNKGKKLSEATKKKISKAKKGTQPCLGYKHPPEYCAAISKRMKGRQHTLGLKHSEESKIKMSLAKKGKKYKPMSQEGKNNIKKAHQTKYSNFGCIQKDLNGIFIKKYDNIYEAIDKYNLRTERLLECYTGTRQIHKGYKWEVFKN